jgi:ubiquinone/menaquinone biosynthesis C-methylase UbiE
LLITLIPFIALLAPALYRDANRAKEIAKLMPLMGLQPGMTAADIGAGEGQMAIPLAQRLGPNGQVFGVEIDPSALRQLRENIRGAGLRNVTAVEGALEQANLPSECCDAIIMTDAYHLSVARTRSKSRSGVL